MEICEKNEYKVFEIGDYKLVKELLRKEVIRDKIL